jgi:DNA-directed RNA polymerase
MTIFALAVIACSTGDVPVSLISGVHWKKINNIITYKETMPVVFKFDLPPLGIQVHEEYKKNKMCQVETGKLCAFSIMLDKLDEFIEEEFKTQNWKYDVPRSNKV